MEPGATEGTLVVPNREGEAVGEPSLDRPATRLAYVSRQATPDASGPQQESRGDVWLADLASGTQRLVVEDGALPQLSPDGATIAFNRRGHEYLVPSGGGEPRDLGEGGCAVWSPDGTRLAMCTNDDTVFVLRIADGQRTDVPTGAGPNDPTAWSPDGSQLALSSTRDGDAEIYVVGRRRVRGAAADGRARWTGRRAVAAGGPAGGELAARCGPGRLVPRRPGHGCAERPAVGPRRARPDGGRDAPLTGDAVRAAARQPTGSIVRFGASRPRVMIMSTVTLGSVAVVTFVWNRSSRYLIVSGISVSAPL